MKLYAMTCMLIGECYGEVECAGPTSGCGGELADVVRGAVRYGRSISRRDATQRNIDTHDINVSHYLPTFGSQSSHTIGS
jgi:hypothetical protein